jgi:hypothetical protein
MLLFLILLSLSFCCEEVSEEERLIAEILCKSADFLEKKYDMRAIETIEGGPDGLNFLGLGFHVYKELKKEDIRIILVEASQYFLNSINKEYKLMPYMSNYPFTLNNIRISLVFKHKDGNDIDHPDIGMASISKHNFLIYKTSRGEYCDTVTTEKESFEDALKIVEESRVIKMGVEK